jgi:hypothetical protein
MQSGTSNGGGSSTGTITFPVTFNNTPVVIATILNQNTANVYIVEITSISPSGFSFIKRFQNASSAGAWGNALTESFYWIAMRT